MTAEEIRRIAERVTDALFARQCTLGNCTTRIVLNCQHGLTDGGWKKDAVEDRIMDILTKELSHDS